MALTQPVDMNTATTAGPYDAAFFARMNAAARSSADVVVPLMMEWLHPTSVVDVGCGQGEWLARFRQAGVSSILGIDGPWVDQNSLAIPQADFQVRSLDQPWELPESFDLCCCLEVAEHLPHASADSLVRNLTTASDAVLFSAALPGQQGTDHINEQWPEYWERKFTGLGFLKLDVIRPRIWQNSAVGWYYQQNMYLYLRESCLPEFPHLRELYERSKDCELTLVHPKVLRPMTRLKAAIRHLPGLFRQTWRRRVAATKAGAPSTCNVRR